MFLLDDRPRHEEPIECAEYSPIFWLIASTSKCLGRHDPANWQEMSCLRIRRVQRFGHGHQVGKKCHIFVSACGYDGGRGEVRRHISAREQGDDHTQHRYTSGTVVRWIVVCAGRLPTGDAPTGAAHPHRTQDSHPQRARRWHQGRIRWRPLVCRDGREPDRAHHRRWRGNRVPDPHRGRPGRRARFCGAGAGWRHLVQRRPGQQAGAHHPRRHNHRI